jgi:putative DNA primase/helicase
MSTDITTSPDLPAKSCAPAEESRKRVMEFMDAVRVSDVETREQHWLWPGRIPLVDVTLLVGDPGVGKSLLALDLAARVTRGGPWPDELGPEATTENKPSPIPHLPAVEGIPHLSTSPHSSFDIRHSSFPTTPGSVILFSAEDTLPETIRPRLEAAGADCSRVVAIRMSVTLKRKFSFLERDEPPNFELRRDVRDLWKLIHVTPDCRLVVIDSMNSCLSENSEHARVDDWGLLLRLAGFARRARIAMLLVSHLRKKGGRAISCSLGSLAFAATARAVWAVAKDPDAAERRLFVPVKNNLAADTSGLAFSIESGSAGSAARIRWSSEPVNAAADAVLSYSRRNGRPDDERKHAISWLAGYLNDGPRPAREVREAADANAIGYGTLRRAFRDLRAQALRENPHPRSPWLWQLSITDAQNPRGEFCASVSSRVEDTPNPRKDSRERIEDAQI